MRMSWKLGRVAGIDLFLHPTFLILLAFVGLIERSLGAVLLVSTVFGCVLLHELGHALMARWFGITTQDITLYPIGGVARLRRLPRAPGAEMLIALAGPAVNVAIAVALWAGLRLVAGGLQPAGALGSWVVQLLMYNVYLVGFNLLPAFPMDGGRVLRALLSCWLGRGLATEIAATLGRALMLILGLLGLRYGNPLLAVLAAFIFVVGGAELAQVRADEHRRSRLQPGSADGGLWVAPPGYLWVDRGNGVWQLAPVAVAAPEAERPWR
ncbi:MAG TPA: site-2 protease family protein [Isosphaeraceae bacterium]